MYNFTEGNVRKEVPQSGSDVPIASEDASHAETNYLESTFAIESIDPNLDATEEIVARFDFKEDVESDHVVAI